jgi:FkbM family methyltransferase
VLRGSLKGFLHALYDRAPLKQPLFELARRVGTPPERLYRHLLFRGVFETRVDDRSFLMQHYGFQVENELFWSGLNGRWEGASLSLWTRLCRTAQVIIDVGANTGVYALAAKAINPSAKVIAFEPVERVFTKLRHNCALNHFDVICEPVALSDEDGEATIYDLDSVHTYSVTINKNLHGPETSVVERRVKTVKLDTYIDQHAVERIDLLKIDVETHEPEVLAGFREHLAVMRPAMLVEVIRPEVARRLEELVAPLGYQYFDIDETKGPRQVPRITVSRDLNYLLCSPEQARALHLT